MDRERHMSQALCIIDRFLGINFDEVSVITFDEMQRLLRFHKAQLIFQDKLRKVVVEILCFHRFLLSSPGQTFEEAAHLFEIAIRTAGTSGDDDRRHRRLPLQEILKRTDLLVVGHG